jgi:hypothetical protein
MIREMLYPVEKKPEENGYRGKLNGKEGFGHRWSRVYRFTHG